MSVARSHNSSTMKLPKLETNKKEVSVMKQSLETLSDETSEDDEESVFDPKEKRFTSLNKKRLS